MDNEITKLDRLLNQIQLLDPPYQESEQGRQLYQEICKFVFEGQFYARIWSEPTLNLLDRLFQTETPSGDLFETELEEIRKRTIAITEVNDFFSGVLDPSMTNKDLCELLAKLECLRIILPIA